MTSVLLPLSPTPIERDQRPTSGVRDLAPRRASDEELVRDLRRGVRSAGEALFNRYGGYVERLLWGLLGPQPDVEDLLHDVFVRAFAGIESLENPERVRSWLAGIAVHTTREWMRRRKRSWWLSFVGELPDVATLPPSEETSEATRCTFEILQNMQEEERIVFSLRFIEGMEMAEIALACDMSLSTIKRRLKSAEAHFLARARRVPALESWLEDGSRWAP